MIYLYLFGTCFHFIYVFMIIGKIYSQETETIQNLENIPIFVRNKKNNSI